MYDMTKSLMTKQEHSINFRLFIIQKMPRALMIKQDQTSSTHIRRTYVSFGCQVDIYSLLKFESLGV